MGTGSWFARIHLKRDVCVCKIISQPGLGTHRLGGDRNKARVLCGRKKEATLPEGVATARRAGVLGTKMLVVT